jgi:osmotically-inducible protein OsmY
MDTDQQLFQAIVAEFRNNRVLHYLRLNLHVEEGVVTISGRVNSLAERNAVERAARRVAGIKTLVLEIRAAAIPMTIEFETADRAEFPNGVLAESGRSR